MMFQQSLRQLQQMHAFKLIPHGLSYCVSLTLRRICSTEAVSSKKSRKQTEALNKKSKSADKVDQTEQTDQSEEKKKVKEPKKKKKTNSELLAEHVAQEPPAVQEILHQYSDQLNKRKQDPDVYYIINENIADEVVRHLDSRLDIPHLELGCGPGVLTRRLLQAGVTSINCFEPTPLFRNIAQSLGEESGGAVRVTPLCLLHLPKFCVAASHGEESRLRRVLDGVQRRSWDADPCLRIVGVAHRSTFFRYLVHTVVNRDYLFQFGRPELLVFMPESEYQRLSSYPGMGGHVYRPYGIMSQIMFDLQELARIPSKHFYPWMMARKRVSLTDMDMVLVRYCPKVDPGVPESELPKLDFFVRHCAVSKTRRIVPQLEEWVPGCGPRLIALGHGVFDPFRDLGPPELLQLFLEFASWPEYPACSFHAAVQQHVMGPETEETEEEHHHLSSETPADEHEEDMEHEPFH